MGDLSWDALRDCNRPEGELAMSAYLDAPEPQPTHVSKLDQLLGGGMTRGLTVLGGPPSAGKSVLACLVAERLASHGRRVVYASYEMSWEVVQLRCASAWSVDTLGNDQFSWSDVVNGTEKRKHEEYEGLDRGTLSRYLVGNKADKVTRALTAWDEGPGRNLAVITDGSNADQLCEAMRSVDGQKPVLIVDYLQIMPTAEKQEQSEYQRVTEVTNKLQSLVYSEGGCDNVLALSSTRNLTSQDYQKGPSLEWFRGSGYIGFAAEQAVIITADKERDRQSGQDVPLVAQDGGHMGRITVVKNKSGASGISIPTLLYGWCNWMR